MLQTKVARLVLMAMFVFESAYAVEEWKLRIDEDGIQVFTMSMPDSDFDTFKAKITLDVSLSTIMAVHFDVNTVKDWMKNCDESQLLSEKISAEGYQAYFKTDSPWPVDDRDYILTYDIVQDPKDWSVTLSFSTISDLVPKNEGTVRVTKLSGYWKMTPVQSEGDEGPPKVSLVYEVSADPGGDIPAWLANSFTVEQPLLSLKKLRKQVFMEKYQNKSFSFIQDPIASIGALKERLNEK